MLANLPPTNLLITRWIDPRIIIIGPLILSYGTPWALIFTIIFGFLAGVNPERGAACPRRGRGSPLGGFERSQKRRVRPSR